MQATRIPLMTRGEAWGSALFSMVFASLPILLLVTEGPVAATSAALLSWPYVYYFFGPALKAIGGVLVVDDSGIELYFGNQIEWSLRWEDIRSARMKFGISAATVIALATDRETQTFAFSLTPAQREVLYRDVTSHLPEGVTLGREEGRYRQVRRSHLKWATFWLLLASGCLGCALAIYEMIAMDVPLPAWMTRLNLLGLPAMVALTIGLLEFVGYLRWKPPHEIEPVVIRGNLFGALGSLQQGHVASASARFAYPEKYRRMVLSRELRKGWWGIGCLWAFFAAIFLVMWLAPDTERAAAAEPPWWMLIGMTVLVLGLFTIQLFLWRKGLVRVFADYRVGGGARRRQDAHPRRR